jgi:hypothetical protein
MRYTVYRIIVCSRTKIRMISSLRNFSVRVLDADLFTIVVFQILDIKSNYLPGIVQCIISYLFGGGITTLDLCDRVAPSKISAKRSNAYVCSSPTLKNGTAVCGCNSAWVSSVAHFVASSCVEVNGNLNFSGGGINCFDNVLSSGFVDVYRVASIML